VTRGRSVGAAALVAAGVVVADQATKALVRASIARGEPVEVFGGLRLINGRNSGVAFGLFSDGGAIVAVLAGLALLAVLAFFVVHADRPLAWLAVGLLAGGAAGNVVDRVREGAVTDFIDFSFWPAFNVADIAVTSGVLLLLWVAERSPARDG
jgi:signal peptidase II